MLIAKPHIGTAAFVFFGGASFTSGTIEVPWLQDADDAWPDVLLLLEPGIVVGKHYVSSDSPLSGKGYLEFVTAGEDSLLVFTAAMIALMNERSVQIEDPTYLSLYIQRILSTLPSETVPFCLTRPPSGRSPIWRSA